MAQVKLTFIKHEFSEKELLQLIRVPCTIEFDEVARVARYYRQDNGKLAKERAMTPEEMQQELPI